MSSASGTLLPAQMSQHASVSASRGHGWSYLWGACELRGVGGSEEGRSVHETKRVHETKMDLWNNHGHRKWEKMKHQLHIEVMKYSLSEEKLDNLWIMLLENNQFRLVNSNCALCQATSHHLAVDYYPYNTRPCHDLFLTYYNVVKFTTLYPCSILDGKSTRHTDLNKNTAIVVKVKVVIKKSTQARFNTSSGLILYLSNYFSNYFLIRLQLTTKWECSIFYSVLMLTKQLSYEWKRTAPPLSTVYKEA